VAVILSFVLFNTKSSFIATILMDVKADTMKKAVSGAKHAASAGYVSNKIHCTIMKVMEQKT